jgi:hypothetical protein
MERYVRLLDHRQREGDCQVLIIYFLVHKFWPLTHAYWNWMRFHIWLLYGHAHNHMDDYGTMRKPWIKVLKYFITELSIFNTKLWKWTAWFSGHLTSHKTQALCYIIIHAYYYSTSVCEFVWSINTGSPYTCMATFHVWLSWSSNVLLRRWRGKKVGEVARSSLTHNKVHNLVPTPNLKYNSAQSLIVTFCDKNNINTFMKSGCITTVLVAVKGSAELIQSPHIRHNPQPVL